MNVIFNFGPSRRPEQPGPEAILEIDGHAGDAARAIDADAHPHGDDCRCLCGNLLARVVGDRVELKCRRCKRTLLIPLAAAARRRPRARSSRRFARRTRRDTNAMHEASGREPRAQFSPQPPLRASQGSARCSLSLFAVWSRSSVLGSGVALAQPPDASLAPPSDGQLAQEDRIAELERTVKVLADELERTRADVTVPEEEELESQFGLGPAASKVFGAARGLALGGYAEGYYKAIVNDADGEQNHTDLLRAVLYVGYKFNENIVFNSEIEFEHATTEETDELGPRRRVGRVRDARLLLASVGERARGPRADPDGLHQPDPRAPVLPRREPARGRAPADSRHLERERRGHLRRDRRAGRLRALRDERAQREGLPGERDPRRAPEGQRSAGRGSGVHGPARLDAAARAAGRRVGLRRQRRARIRASR